MQQNKVSIKDQLKIHAKTLHPICDQCSAEINHGAHKYGLLVFCCYMCKKDYIEDMELDTN